MAFCGQPKLNPSMYQQLNLSFKPALTMADLYFSKVYFALSDLSIEFYVVMNGLS